MINKEINFDESTIKILFSKYKALIIPVVIIFVSIILFFKVIIPQIEELTNINNEVKTRQQRVLTLRENLQFLSRINNNDQAAMLQNLTKAMPSEKDFVGILNAISNASINAAVKLDDFSFVVGDLSTKSTQLAKRPSLNLVVTINGGVNGVEKFLNELSKSLPLSEVETVDISGNSSTAKIAFYYRALPLIKINYASPFKPLSADEKKLFDKISSWQSGTSNISQQGTSSSLLMGL